MEGIPKNNCMKSSDMIVDNYKQPEIGDSVPVTTYKSARAVSGLVANHFNRHHISAKT